LAETASQLNILNGLFINGYTLWLFTRIFDCLLAKFSTRGKGSACSAILAFYSIAMLLKY